VPARTAGARRLSRLTWAGIGLQLAALACIVVVLVRLSSTGIEGAYFNREPDAPGWVGYAPLELFDPRPWLAAAAVLLVGGTLPLILGARSAARRSAG
jgi:hypothetical protein